MSTARLPWAWVCAEGGIASLPPSLPSIAGAIEAVAGVGEGMDWMDGMAGLTRASPTVALPTRRLARCLRLASWCARRWGCRRALQLFRPPFSPPPPQIVLPATQEVMPFPALRVHRYLATRVGLCVCLRPWAPWGLLACVPAVLIPLPPSNPLHSHRLQSKQAPPPAPLQASTMRLITHNMLKSNIKGVVNGFPLRIEADKVEVKETEFNPGALVVLVGWWMREGRLGHCG